MKREDGQKLVYVSKILKMIIKIITIIIIIVMEVTVYLAKI